MEENLLDSHAVVVVWPSGGALVSVNEVNLRRPPLVLGWMTVSGFSQPGQLSLAIPS